MGTVDQVRKLLGDEAEDLLTYKPRGIPKSSLNLPGPDFVSRVLEGTDRPTPVLRSLQALFGHGRLAGTGYMSILPVDQGVEHSAGASFAKNPAFFDPENIVKLAVEGGCNAVASTVGVLGAISRRYAHRIPMICKLNHNELLTYPNRYGQTMFADVHQAFDLGAVAVGATIYFGHDTAREEIQEVGEAFTLAHELGLACILWCYLRNKAFRTDQANYQTAADLTSQANHLGATLQADIVKQKAPECNGGYTALDFGKTDKRVYEELTPGDHPIEMTRYQVAGAFMGRVPLINSGGASGKNDFAAVARTAVINKRAGGSGLITGRKAFQRPMDEGVKLLNLVQDIYLAKEIAVG
ncbi:MAG: class I fructose-bisphosphate aldolase [Planctomycetes bacterium]|nr:class I fructose-bisphosphate aldolase [Planctomycetota bacterium]